MSCRFPRLGISSWHSDWPLTPAAKGDLRQERKGRFSSAQIRTPSYGSEQWNKYRPSVLTFCFGPTAAQRSPCPSVRAPAAALHHPAAAAGGAPGGRGLQQRHDGAQPLGGGDREGHPAPAAGDGVSARFLLCTTQAPVPTLSCFQSSTKYLKVLYEAFGMRRRVSGV